ncbi:uncharacterized protein LOC144437941 [Glandiceps talaboti]
MSDSTGDKQQQTTVDEEQRQRRQTEEGEDENEECEIICPTIEELMKQPQTNLTCTVPGCSRIISNPAAMKMHLNKVHHIYEHPNEAQLFVPLRRTGKKKSVTKLFYCPIEGCRRSVGSKRHFARLPLVKQHYLKMHAEKKMFCRKCEKGFSTQSDCKRHEEICGRLFYCGCGCPYSTREALLTHQRRQQHSLPSQPKDKLKTITFPSPETVLIQRKPEQPKKDKKSSSVTESKKSTVVPILPRPSFQYVPVMLAVPIGVPIPPAPVHKIRAFIPPAEDNSRSCGAPEKLPNARGRAESVPRTLRNQSSESVVSQTVTSESVSDSFVSQSLSTQTMRADTTCGQATQTLALRTSASRVMNRRSCTTSTNTSPKMRQKQSARKRHHVTTQTSTGVQHRTTKHTQTSSVQRKRVKTSKHQNFQDSGSNTDTPLPSGLPLNYAQDIQTQTSGDCIIKQAMLSVDIDTQTNEHLLGLSVDAYTSTTNPVINMETQTNESMPPMTHIPGVPDLNQSALSNAHTQTYRTINPLDLDIPPTTSCETQTFLASSQQPSGNLDMTNMIHFTDSLDHNNSSSVTSTVTQTETQSTGSFGGLSDSQTQTFQLLQDLNSIIGWESSATQTQESFLNETACNDDVHNNTVETQTREADDQVFHSNGVQTDTMEFDFENLITDQEAENVCVDFTATDPDVEFLDSYAQTNLQFAYNGADNFTQTGNDSFFGETEVVDIHTQTSATVLRVAEDFNTMTTQTVSSTCTDMLATEHNDCQVQVDLQTATKSTDTHTQTAVNSYLSDQVEQTDMETQTFGRYEYFPPSSTELAHTETQTLFSDLGILTDSSLTDSHTQTYFHENKNN